MSAEEGWVGSGRVGPYVPLTFGSLIYIYIYIYIFKKYFSCTMRAG